MLLKHDDAPTPPPRWSEWTPERQALVDIFDRLGELIASVIAAGGGKPPTIPRHPRPVTAADRARAQMRAARHLQLVAVLLPESTAEQEGGTDG